MRSWTRILGARRRRPQRLFAARRLRGLLDAVGLPATLMTTGSRGLHVAVSLDRRADHDTVRDFAHDVAGTLAAAHPDDLTPAAREQARGDRLYPDVQRNGYARTAVAPYAVRARPGAPVATPIRWEQLDDPALHPRRWTVADVLDQARSDPWDGTGPRPRSLGPARRRPAGLG